MNRIPGAAALCLCVGVATAADAAVISADGAAFNDPGGFGFVFTAAGVDGLDVAIFADFDTEGRETGPGVVDFTDASGLVLGGSTASAAILVDPDGADSIVFTVRDASGSAAAAFDGAFLATITGDFGSDIPALFAAGFSADATVTVGPLSRPTPIPAPPAGPLALIAVAALVAARLGNTTRN